MSVQHHPEPLKSKEPSAASMNAFKPLHFLAWIFFAFTHCAFGFVSVGDLRCEYRENPQGIDVAQPRLSWTLQSTNRDERQTAYQLVVSVTSTPPSSNAQVVWDTGKVRSGES